MLKFNPWNDLIHKLNAVRQIRFNFLRAVGNITYVQVRVYMCRYICAGARIFSDKLHCKIIFGSLVVNVFLGM